MKTQAIPEPLTQLLQCIDETPHRYREDFIWPGVERGMRRAPTIISALKGTRRRRSWGVPVHEYLCEVKVDGSPPHHLIYREYWGGRVRHVEMKLCYGEAIAGRGVTFAVKGDDPISWPNVDQKGKDRNLADYLMREMKNLVSGATVIEINRAISAGAEPYFK